MSIFEGLSLLHSTLPLEPLAMQQNYLLNQEACPVYLQYALLCAGPGGYLRMPNDP